MLPGIRNLFALFFRDRFCKGVGQVGASFVVRVDEVYFVQGDVLDALLLLVPVIEILL